MTAHALTLETPDGPFTVVAEADEVLASGWTADVDALLALVHPGRRPAAVALTDPPATLTRAADAVRAYYAGDLTAPGRVPVAQTSGEFREQAWTALRRVGPGETITYTELAARAGRPSAVRAAAGACAMNAAALFVPCHRIVRTDGSLGGFRYGLEIKQRLLAREQTG